jgi:molecular chaperone HscB
LTRAQYLLQLLGHPLQADTNTVMDPEFLMEQMEWREAVQEAREAGSVDDLEELHHRLRQAMHERYEELGRLFETALNAAPEVASAAEAAIGAAAELTRRLMFLDRLRHEIDDALADLDA